MLKAYDDDTLKKFSTLTFTFSKSPTETLEKGLKYVSKFTNRDQWRCSGFFIVNCEHISQLFLVFLLLGLNK